MFLNSGVAAPCSYAARLTVTKVVFELWLFMIKIIVIMGLTVTKVVFECI